MGETVADLEEGAKMIGLVFYHCPGHFSRSRLGVKEPERDLRLDAVDAAAEGHGVEDHAAPCIWDGGSAGMAAG